MSNRNQRLQSFVITFGLALIVGIFILLVGVFIWDTPDPRFYQLLIPAYFSAALILALMSSLER